MKNPGLLGHLDVFRALGRHLSERYSLGIQLVQKNSVSRPLVLGGNNSLEQFIAAIANNQELTEQHRQTLMAIERSKEAQIVEHPAGFQVLTVPCQLASGRAQIAICPLLIDDPRGNRRDKVERYLKQSRIGIGIARTVADSLKSTERSELEFISELSRILAREAEEHSEWLEQSERRLDELRKKNRSRYLGLIGQSLPMQELFLLLDRIAPSDSTVFISGENGTGKELVAREVHHYSRRADAPFVIQNCSALNENLLESEVFGHKHGAFTGAIADKPGLFDMADGGTIFLDEIGDMSPALQAKLLRVLQDGTFLPVGANVEHKVDVRVICATNRKLKKMVEDGDFREDLYYRINVINVDMPPLRDRRDDIPLLVEYFLAKPALNRQGPGGRKKLSKEAMQRLMEFDWPGNVRELENEVQRLVVLAGSLVSSISEDLLSPRIRHRPLSLAPGNSKGPTLPDALERLEREMIYAELRKNRWNKTRTAKVLGISRRNLIRKVERYGFDRRST